MAMVVPAAVARGGARNLFKVGHFPLTIGAPIYLNEHFIKY